MFRKILFIKIKYVICLFTYFFINVIKCDKDCWTNFGAAKHFEIMNGLDERYDKVKSNYEEKIGGENFDKKMLAIMLKNRGKAERAIHAAQRDYSTIPAGINLGGYSMMKMPKSLLFFHRMKLRNKTMFRINRLKNHLADLTVDADISLHDLHLFGSYDFTNILSKPYILSYDPTYGQIELLLKNVKYKMEGRYRLLKNKLKLEMITSDTDLDAVLVSYRNKNSTYSFGLQKKNIDIFLDRLKVDLDKWLKDYFNDYLMYHVVAEDDEFEKYNQEKTTALNEFADKIIDKVVERLNEIKATSIQLPPFELHTMSVAEITLRDGVLRGLDSIYRRSVTTGTKKNNVRKIDTTVGFSNLKLSYRYDAKFKSGLPAVTGVLTLAADDLLAHMSMSLTRDPETADLSFMFLEQAKPESLTVEGPAGRMISNFKYLLERHIIAIMTNTLIHNIKMLGTLDRCVPNLMAYNEMKLNGHETSKESRESKPESEKEMNEDNSQEHTKDTNKETETNNMEDTEESTNEPPVENSGSSEMLDVTTVKKDENPEVDVRDEQDEGEKELNNNNDGENLHVETKEDNDDDDDHDITKTTEVTNVVLKDITVPENEDI